MKHPEAAEILQNAIVSLEKLDDQSCLRSTNCISKMLLLDQQLSKLIRFAVDRAIDERDCLQVEF